MDDAEIERIASSINFLRYFKYEPRVVCFAPETGCFSDTAVKNEITLSQFSAAEVPKCNMEAEQGDNSLISAQSRKDFILYTGGLVWALDWCPRAEQGTEFDTKYELIGPFSFRADSTIAIDLRNQEWKINLENPVFAIEYALHVLGSAKAIAWYAPNQKEFMVELRFFER